jgi:hypothetical protein
MNPDSLASLSRDLGVCGSINCPLCMELRRFHLLHVHDGMTKEGFHVVMCESCRCTRDVPEAEIEAALAAVELFHSSQQGEIDSFSYRIDIPLLRFHTLRAMHLEGASWQCPSCGEKSPANFAECWKCQAVRLGHESACAAAVDSEAPNIPNTSLVNNPERVWE